MHLFIITISTIETSTTKQKPETFNHGLYSGKQNDPQSWRRVFQHYPNEIYPIEIVEDDNERHPPPTCRSAGMNLGIFSELQPLEIVNPLIPTLAVKPKRDMENGDSTSLFMAVKQAKKQWDRSMPWRVTNPRANAKRVTKNWRSASCHTIVSVYCFQSQSTR